MEEGKLSKRLSRVAQYIRKGDRLADIGSDHAYLPSALVEEGVVSFAVAGEVVPGPLERARRQVRLQGLEDSIDVRHGNGLEVVSPEDEITAVSICGMGGVLITDILERGREEGRLTGRERLILQPNVGEYNVRKWLLANSYTIVAEELVEENDKMYEIIVAEKSETPPSYTEKELKYGVYLPTEHTELFKKKWTHELEKSTFILEQLAQSNSPQEEKINELKRHIEETKGMIS
ncbi:tRNA (adenine(22)-N(1))-methyltransferase [Atopococcus tabaci]|uniref:tRNA (adenine(22)-N(1))-methyltransferase n=1 Tax=Atopococcus tabaci TaxID=269774 RepID=UPI00240A6B22|nr:tRNA (adenine(22)-N(1))-methyltransferase TrmK [Atopococcus tabaci]